MKSDKTVCFSYSLCVPNSMSFPRLWLGMPLLPSLLIKLLYMLPGLVQLFHTSNWDSTLIEDVLSVRSSEVLHICYLVLYKNCAVTEVEINLFILPCIFFFPKGFEKAGRLLMFYFYFLFYKETVIICFSSYNHTWAKTLTKI